MRTPKERQSMINIFSSFHMHSTTRSARLDHEICCYCTVRAVQSNFAWYSLTLHELVMLSPTQPASSWLSLTQCQVITLTTWCQWKTMRYQHLHRVLTQGSHWVGETQITLSLHDMHFWNYLCHRRTKAVMSLQALYAQNSWIFPVK